MTNESNVEKMTWGQVLFSFKGRISRSTFWLRGWLPLIAIQILGLIIDLYIGDEPGIFFEIAILLTIWPECAIIVKRLHDHNVSGWFLLITLIPIIGPLWLFLDFLIFKGTKGDNRFGPDPLR